MIEIPPEDICIVSVQCDAEDSDSEFEREVESAASPPSAVVDADEIQLHTSDDQQQGLYNTAELEVITGGVQGAEETGVEVSEVSPSET